MTAPNQETSLFFVTLPKSGTVFLWTNLCEITGLSMPPFISDPEIMKELETGYWEDRDEFYDSGDFYWQRLEVNGLRRAIGQPLVFGTHMGASYWNLRTMAEAGMRKTTVLMRDPRDNVVSWTYHLEKLGPATRNYTSIHQYLPDDFWERSHEEQLAYNVRTFLPGAISWIESWFGAAVDPQFPELDINLVYFDELKNDPRTMFRSIVDFHGFENCDLSTVKAPEAGQRHYRKGEHEQWRKEFSESDLAFCESLIGDRLTNAYARASAQCPALREAVEAWPAGRADESREKLKKHLRRFPRSRPGLELAAEAFALPAGVVARAVEELGGSDTMLFRLPGEVFDGVFGEVVA